MSAGRPRRMFTVFGETLTADEWAARIGVAQKTIFSRLDKGWSIEDAVTRRPEPKPQAIYTVGEISLSIPEWAERAGLTPQAIYIRLRNGEPIERAIEPRRYPVRKRKTKPAPPTGTIYLAKGERKKVRRLEMVGSTLQFPIPKTFTPDDLRRLIEFATISLELLGEARS